MQESSSCSVFKQVVTYSRILQRNADNVEPFITISHVSPGYTKLSKFVVKMFVGRSVPVWHGFWWFLELDLVCFVAIKLQLKPYEPNANNDINPMQ